jgi:uncharacterized repeat protein (TIGR01451 family)
MSVRGDSIKWFTVSALVLSLALMIGPVPVWAQAPQAAAGPTNNPGYSPQPAKVTVTGSVQATPGPSPVDKVGEGAAANNQQNPFGLDSAGALVNAAERASEGRGEPQVSTEPDFALTDLPPRAEGPGTLGGDWGALVRFGASGEPVVVHRFGLTDGAFPVGAPIQGRDGFLYGVATSGGRDGKGTLYRLSPDGSRFAVLHHFSGGEDGGAPQSGLAVDPTGRIFGTASTGGENDHGVVFRLSREGGFRVLHAFGGPDGEDPRSLMIAGEDGAVVGVTRGGGEFGQGTLFHLGPKGRGFASLHSFLGHDGVNPEAALLLGSDGMIHGVAPSGGIWGAGTAFRISRDGVNFEVVHAFKACDIGAGPCSDGSHPLQEVAGAEGWILGRTLEGGAFGRGALYLRNPTGTEYVLIYSYKGVGDVPRLDLVPGKDGKYYALVQGPDGKGQTLRRVYDPAPGPPGEAGRILTIITPQAGDGLGWLPRSPLAGPYPDPCQFTSLGAYTAAAGMTTFDTDALTYGGTAGGVISGGAAVFTFSSITVPAGATIRGVGSRPLALLSQSSVQIDGTVHVNGSTATPTAPSCQANTLSPGGAGGGAGGRGTTANPGAGNSGSGPGGGGGGPAGTAGSGGGGYGGAGGAGGSGGGAGGAAYGDLVTTFQGGSGGGGAGTNSGDGCQGASGGGGGGGLLISALWGGITISSTGVVSADGGNGALSDEGASAGGSGGAVVLRAPNITHNGAARANGGGGGAGGCCGGGGGGGGGRILVAGSIGGPGTLTVAGGGGGSGSGAGGSGTAGSIVPRVFDTTCRLAPCEFPSLGTFTAPAGTTVFNTDTGTFGAGTGGINLGGNTIFMFDGITVPNGATVQGVGTFPLVLLSRGSVLVGGTIHVNGSNATGTAPTCAPNTPSPGGPGGFAGGRGTTANPGAGSPGSGPGGGGGGPAGTAGSGGGGYGGAGGAGGSGGGAGGAAYGDLTTTFQGGGGGGGAGTSSGDGCQGATGGGGGGALMISAGTDITIAATGVVASYGGSGALSDEGASAGGGGGAVILRAPLVTNNGATRANGGGGGPGGCCGGGGGGGGGRVLVIGTPAGVGSYAVAGGGGGSGSGAGTTGSTGVTTTTGAGGILVTKTDGQATEVPGTTVTYTITISNTGPAAAGIPVTDTPPGLLSGVTYTASATGGATGFTASGTAEIDDDVTLPAGSSITYSLTGTIDPAATGTLTNSVCAGVATAADVDTLVPNADLQVTKTDSPDPVTAGTDLTYTVNLTNAGPSDGHTVTVTDAVPPNTTFVSASVTTGSGWGIASPAVGGTGNVVFSKGTVALGETATFSIVVHVLASVASGTTITNSATAATADVDPTPANSTGTATTTVQTSADLQVTKTDSPDPVTAGTDLTYTINLANAGPSDGHTVAVTDAVPPNTTFVSASVTTGSGWGITAPAVGGTGNVVFSKGTVALSETATFSIVVHVLASAANGSMITNSATAAGAGGDPNPANNTGTATTTVQTRADLRLTKADSPDPVTIGTDLTYTLNLVDAGPSDAQTVTVTDAVPADTTFVSAAVTSGSGWTLSSPAVGGTGNVVFSKATVAFGEATTFSMVVHVAPTTPGGFTLTNSAVAASTTTDPDPTNNTATASTTMVCPTITLTPNLPGGQLGKPYSQTITASPGGTIYTYAVTAGSLPPGLALNGATGAITGTPTTLGASSFTVTATGWGTRCSGSQAYTFAVYTVFFQDDILRSKMCVNFVTGAYAWQILSGPGAGVYTGTANVLNGGAKVVSKPGAADVLNLTYDALRKKASGYFITAAGVYSPLSDSNTINNVGGCP